MEMEVFFRAAPEISDPEYYLKEAVRYPGKQIRGGIRRENRKQIIAGLRSKNCRNLSIVLTGFIWMKKRVFCMCITGLRNGEGGFNQNHYGSPEEAKDFPVLEGGVGVCRDFAEEFQFLCQIVGLECDLHAGISP